MGESDLAKTHEKEVAKLEAVIDAYKTEVRRLCKAVERAEEEAARWRRKAKKLKKRESTVILSA
jgi:phage shock protein A